MKTLIVEDDPTCRLLLQGMLKGLGPVQVAVNGADAIETVRLALEANEPFDLVCMDIMMPEMDGQEAVAKIRAMEEERGIYVGGAKIVMTTALDDMDNVRTAYSRYCDLYLVKPIEKAPLLDELRKLKLIE